MAKAKDSERLKKAFPSYGLETEIKFLTDKETMDRIFDDIQSGPFPPNLVDRDRRTNIYYDTKKAFQLYRKGYELRSRLKGEKHKYDLKTPKKLTGASLGVDKNGIFKRREYSYLSGANEPKLEQFAKGDMADHLAGLEDKDLVPWVQGHFKRKRFTYTPQGYPDTHLEVAFESGHYENMDGSEKSETMYIIEIELKSGDYDGLVEVANGLERQYGLSVCLKTKGEMGMEFIHPSLEQDRQEKFEEAQAERLTLYKQAKHTPLS